MKINEASLKDILGAYDDPNVQQAAVEFIGLLRTFDRTGNDENIYKMDDVAERIAKRIPYDEVNFNSEWTNEPSFVLMVSALKMIELGYLPSLENPKDL
tara:strand:+ start:157 stop:453 length:297 start_codon:yes stop_codon:yes gene_type:complete